MKQTNVAAGAGHQRVAFALLGSHGLFHRLVARYHALHAGQYLARVEGSEAGRFEFIAGGDEFIHQGAEILNPLLQCLAVKKRCE